MDTFSRTAPDLPPFPSRGAFQYITRLLRAALPAPEGDTPADWAERDHEAVAAVAALQPANAAEGRLAAEYVAANAWALDCMRLAQARWREPSIADKCRAQGMGMLRAGKSTLRALEKMQAARKAAEADPAAAERAAWIEHGVTRMMEAALEPVEAAPVAGEDAAERQTERHDGEPRAAVSGVGSVSYFTKNPQEMSYETEVGPRELPHGAAARAPAPGNATVPAGSRGAGSG